MKKFTEDEIYNRIKRSLFISINGDMFRVTESNENDFYCREETYDYDCGGDEYTYTYEELADFINYENAVVKFFELKEII